MLLKWLFTALAILWLIQALRPYFQIQQRPPGPPPSPPPPSPQPRAPRKPNDEDYIDYEEIK